MSKHDFTAVIQKFTERWQKCISAEEQYFEKKKHIDY
jgi:hypothetical protein